jgi:tetratricopeptide (TPR) repeat protein
VRFSSAVALVMGVLALVAPRVYAAPAGASSGKVQSEVEQHLQRGVKLYTEGAIDASIVELEQAYALDPNASVCYALGQAHRKKGACKRAIELYRCAVEKAPDEAFARAANYQIGRCVVAGGNESVETPTAAVVHEEATPPKRPWRRDVAGGVLLGVGLGAVAAGGGLLGHGEALARAATDDLDAYRAAGAVGAQRIAGGVLLAVGGVGILGAVIRYVVVARR